MGGKSDDLIVISAVTLEEGFLGITETINIILAQNSKAEIFIVIDSLGGCPSKAEMEADADETIQLATAAKVIRRSLRNLVQVIDKYKIGVFIINQSYANIGSVGRTPSGGEGASYHSSIIFQTQRVSDIVRQIKGQKVVVGIVTKVRVTKHHLMQTDKTPKEVIFETYAYHIEEK
jgi:RecA/RadA recombinase